MKLATIESILEVGRKYTLVKFTDYGFPYAVQFKPKAFVIKPYAQYPETAYLQFRAKGMQRDNTIRIMPTDKFLIFRGWVKPDVDMYKGMGESLVCFADEYIDIARNSIEPELCLFAAC